MPLFFELFLVALLATSSPPTADSATADSATADSSAADGPADRETLQIYDEVEVRERADDLVGLAFSAGEGITGQADLANRPLLRPGELVETAPGVIATQHSGGGKANQFFLRGFNLDHGTDFSVRVGGVPVNMPTHGHGQGYTDLNFLIPETVASVRYRKGPYAADQGDFSAAGGIDMELLQDVPERLVSLTGGSSEYRRALWLDSFEVGRGELVAAVDLFHHDGPWTRGEDYDGFRGLLRFTRGDAARGSSFTAMAYDADWLSTDQIPRRALAAGEIGRFDLVDAGPRGSTERFSLSAEAHRGRADALSRLQGYLVYYDFDLISNFTYFLDNPARGDQFEQVDERFVAGFSASHRWLGDWGGRRLENGAGFTVRADDVDNGLFRTRDLERFATVRQDRVRQLGGGPWIETTVSWSERVRSRFGLRADAWYADVDSRLGVNSGRADDLLLSPKLSLALGPWGKTEVYLNAGYGFHSNDARGAVIRIDPATGEAVSPVEPLVRAKGADVGFRTTALAGLHSTFTVFWLELDSELVFVGDGGATEASRPSRRVGVEWANHYQLSERVAVDFDLTLTDAEFTDDDPAGDHIPGAIEQTIAAGISFENFGPFSAGLRWRYFADVPLIEDASEVWGSSSLVNARLGYRFAAGLELELEIFNLLDREDSDIEYFYTSRLPGEPLGGVEDVHFHPLERRSARLVARWRR